MASCFLLLICVLMFSAGDYFAALWGRDQQLGALIGAMAIGPIAYILFGYLSATTSLSKMGGYVNSGVVLTTAFAGVLLLGERLGRMAWCGIVLIVLGIALLAMGKTVQEG